MALTGNFRSFTTLFKSISILGLKEGLIKLFLENTDNKEENNRVVSSFLVFFLGFSFFLSILIVLFAEPLSSYLFQTTVFSVYLNYFALLLPFFVLQTLLVTLFNAHQEFKKIVGIQIITNILLFISSFYFIYQQKLEGSLFAIAIADFISFFVAVFFAKRSLTVDFKVSRVCVKLFMKLIYILLIFLYFGSYVIYRIVDFV